jgi:hypothetical protein
MKNGTPAQRQLSISSRRAANVSVVESFATPVDRRVSLVLTAHAVRGVGFLDRAEERHLCVLDRGRIAAGRRLHRGRGDHLHQVVDDDVADRADRVIEVAAVLHPEVLRHRDLDRGEEVAAPDGLEHRVREPEMQDLDEAHLPEVVVDPVELRLVDVLVDVVRKRARRFAIVPEGLLDHDPGRSGQPRLVEPLDHRAEQERWDLQVEDRRSGLGDHVGDVLVGLGIAEVARDVGEPSGETFEDCLVQRLARARDRRPGPFLQIVDGPVVDRHPHDRTVEQTSTLQPVQGAERHHLGEVAGDPEHDEHVRGPVPIRCSSHV